MSSSNPLAASNQYLPGTSAQFPNHFPHRTSFNVQTLDRHPQQLHAHHNDSDQFSNRTSRHTSQPSQTSSHGRSMVNSIPSASYPHHPAHLLQPVANHVAIPPHSFSNLPNPPMMPFNHPDSKSTMFSAQAPNVVNPSSTSTGSNILTSPHFQSGVPPGSRDIPRHMSTTPSLPSSQSERKDSILSHSASYQNSTPSNQHSLEPPLTSHLRSLPQPFSPAQYQQPPPSVEGMTSPTHSRSPAPHVMESQISTSNRKFHPIPSPSLHTLSQRPLTPRSAQTLAATGVSTNSNHPVFQPIHVGYPSAGNVPPPLSISSQARNLQYSLNNQPNPNLKLPGGGQPQQALQVPILNSQSGLMNEPNQFSQLGQFQTQPPQLINSSAASNLMNNNMNHNSASSTIGRPMPPNYNPSQFYQSTIIPQPNPSTPSSHSYSNTATNQQ